MRIVIVSLVAAAVAALAVPAGADPATAGKKKQRYEASKKHKTATDRKPSEGITPDIGYMASPDNYPIGSSNWWAAMERSGRGGFGDIP